MLNITEFFKNLIPLKGTATVDIFKCVKEAVENVTLCWNKLDSVATDAPSMVGVNVGVIARVKERYWCNTRTHCPPLHSLSMRKI